MNYQQILSDFILDNNSSGLNRLFDEPADLTIASIYRNGFFRSCREVLVSTFPSVQSFAGEDLFLPLAQAFIKMHPPNTATLSGYGREFPGWLANQSIDQNPILFQIAELDWSWIACLHGDNATPLTAELFQTLIAENQDSNLPQVSVLDNMQILQPNAEAWNLWLNLKKQIDLPEQAPSATEERKFVIMWRPNMEVFARALSAEEYCFIDAIARHRSLNTASEHVLNKYPDFDLPEQFSALLYHGLLSTN